MDYKDYLLVNIDKNGYIKFDSSMGSNPRPTDYKLILHNKNLL